MNKYAQISTLQSNAWNILAPYESLSLNQIKNVGLILGLIYTIVHYTL